LGFPFLFALCSGASIIIWFVDVEKGRENCREYVEQRKLIRVAKEAGLTTDEVVQGAATGELGGKNSRVGNTEVGLEGSPKDFVQ
jgi:hypothetical protein